VIFHKSFCTKNFLSLER